MTRFQLSAQRLQLLESLLREEGLERAPVRTVTPRPDPSAPVPLTFPQSRLWFLEQLAARTSAYVISAALRIRGPFQPEVFARACQEVVRRHESLRTVFHEAGGQPYQQVREDVCADVRVVDLVPDKVDAEILRREAALVERPFDLTAGPLFRIEILRFAAEDTAVLITMHHLVSDRWSMGVLMRELTALYAALATGLPSDLPELPVQYPDFAQWQQDPSSRAAWETDLAYWAGQLAGAPADAGLAAGRTRPKEKTYRGSSVPVELSPALVAPLRELARAEGATLFMVLAAALKILVSRLGGDEDVVIGTPVANRTLVELEPLIGFFVNTLALRTDLSGDPSFRELLRRVAQVCLDAYDHQNVPFERLVEVLQPERSLASTPVFQVMLSYQNVPFPAWNDGPIRIQPVGLEARKAEFDLLLDLFEDGDTVWGRLEYSSDLFTRSDAQRLVQALHRLLRAAAADPGRPIGDLPLATEEECVITGPVVEWPGAGWVHECFEEQVRRCPGAEAVRFEGAGLSYAEVNRRANRLAWWLRRSGVERGSLVGVLLERSAELVVSLLAVLKSGAVYVPLGSPIDPPVDVVLPRDLDLDAEPGHDLGTAMAGDDVACIVSGTPFSHAELRNLLLGTRDAYEFGPRDRILHQAPPTDDAALREILWALTAGAALVVARPGVEREPRQLADLIRREKITTLHFLPSQLRAFLRAHGMERCPGVRRVICGGEALPRDLQERFFARSRARLHNLYGSWTAWTCRRDHDPRPVPIGSPIANTKVYVLDRRQRPVPAGTTGEVHVVTTTRPGLPNPFDPKTRLHRTGDLARIRDDGALEHLGRIDQHVRIRGFHAHLRDIEAALLQHEGVREAAVAVRHGGSVAYVTGDALPGAAELTAYLRERLPDYMVPAAFVVLPALPRTPDGKADRAALPDVEIAGPESHTEFTAPRDDLERSVAECWRELLGVRQIGAHDNFFDLGGHSLLATKLVAWARSAHGVQLPLREIFDHPTVAGLAARVAAWKDAAAPEPIPTVARDAAIPLSFAQERLCRHHPFPAGDTYHNVPTALVLTGRLDQTALRRALDEVVRRHEALRARIVAGGQVIEAHGTWPLTVVDLRGHEQGTRVDEIIDEESRRPFRLDAEPLVRATLITTAPDEAVLLLVMHHLVTDNWSYAVLVRDLCELYEAHALGRPPRLPELTTGFADVAAWQQHRLATGEAAEQVAYWRRQLAELPTAPTFAAFGDPVTAPATGCRHAFALDAAATKALGELARAADATLFMALMAAFTVLLAEATGRDDVAVTFPEAGRQRAETADLVGYLANDLVVRSHPTGDLTFAALLGQVRATTLGAYAHQGVPLWSVDGVMDGGRDPFRVRFNLLNAPIPAVDLHGLRAAPLNRGGDYVFSEVTADIEPAEADLALIMREDAGELRGMWLYSLDNVGPKAMGSLIRCWPRLVDLVVADPNRTIGELRRQLREEGA